MQLIFADRDVHFLRTLEQLFRQVRVQGAHVVPVVVNSSAEYVYNSLPAWMHACLVETDAGEEGLFTATRTFATTQFKDQPVTKVRVRAPLVASSRGATSTTCRSEAYYAMRAALLAITRIRREQKLDVVVVPRLVDANAHDLYTATQDFFKLQ